LGLHNLHQAEAGQTVIAEQPQRLRLPDTGVQAKGRGGSGASARVKQDGRRREQEKRKQ
jgi:hypothetical protein